MFTLIKREIEDMILFFVFAAVALLIVISILTYQTRMGWEDGRQMSVPSTMYRYLFHFPFILFPFAAAALGATQMKLDSERKISAFLTTLATTRRHILAAKIITGLLWLLFVLGTLAVGDIILLKVYPRFVLPDAVFLVRLFITWFLCGLACYCFGLLAGLRSGRILPAAGILLVTVILVTLIVIKGTGMQTAAIFLLFIAAVGIRTWKNFMTMPL